VCRDYEWQLAQIQKLPQVLNILYHFERIIRTQSGDNNDENHE